MSLTDLAARLQLISEPNIDGLSLTFTTESVSRHGLDYLAIHWTVAAASDVSDVTLRLRWAFPEWTAAPWFMIPGLMYGKNRPDGETSLYPRFEAEAVTPHNFISSHWDFPADRATLPGVFAFLDGEWTILVSEPHFAVTGEVQLPEYEPQVGMGYRCDATAQYMQFSLPATDEPYTHTGSARVAPQQRGLCMRAGASLTGTIYLFNFTADKHGYAQVLPMFAEMWRAQNPPAVLPDMDDLIDAARTGIQHWHFVDEETVFRYAIPYEMIAEQMANAKGFTIKSEQMNVGWVSGIPVCFGLTWAARRCANSDGVRIAHRVVDRFSSEGLSPSGFFWGRFATPHPEASGYYHRGGKYDAWDGGWNPEPEMLHMRTIGEANYFLARLIQLERTHGVDTALWEHALSSNVERVLVAQQRGGTGTFGTYHHALTGEPLGWDGSGGLIWIPALLEAGKVFNESYLAQAIRAGEFYAQHVRDEYLYGTPEDVRLSPTSEDGYNAVIAYAALYETTGDTAFLDLCRTAADWTLTYRKVYNVRFHPKTILGAYDFRTRGGDYASVTNNMQHTYGLICTGELLKLSAWTGNPYYREMALEHLAYGSQYLCLVDGQWNGYRGFAPEQFYACNWTSLGNSLYLHEGAGDKPDWIPPAGMHNKGNFCAYSTLWCINHLLLASEAMEMQNIALA